MLILILLWSAATESNGAILRYPLAESHLIVAAGEKGATGIALHFLFVEGAWDPGDYDLIVISRVQREKNRPLFGKNIAEIAELWQIEPVEAILQLLEEETLLVGFVGHGMSEANVETVLAHPLVMIGSDGYSMAPRGRALQTQPHPRSYGTCARVLGHYVRERKLFDLATAIKKMTAMPADQLGLKDRGRLSKGLKADIVVFDPARIADRATFTATHRFPAGVAFVLVNGKLVIQHGHHTGVRVGQILQPN